jgi:type IV pilus assembly protein PilA
MSLLPRRRGFTLIELLVVVVIIGILAAVAIPKFSQTKGRARTSALKSDLRNLATAQEAYFFQHQNYSNDTLTLGFRPTPGVVIQFETVTPQGWSATAYHQQANPITCAIFVGSVAPPAAFPGINEGSVKCQ